MLGSETCAVLADGTARCWGYGSFGELGDGMMAHRSSPTPVSSLTGVVGFAAGIESRVFVALVVPYDRTPTLVERNRHHPRRGHGSAGLPRIVSERICEGQTG